jgi:hypothetical protein
VGSLAIRLDDLRKKKPSPLLLWKESATIGHFKSKCIFKDTVIYDVTQCTLVNRYQYFEGTCCLYIQDTIPYITTIKESGNSSEMLVPIYQTTRRYNSEDSICNIHGKRTPDLIRLCCYKLNIRGGIF